MHQNQPNPILERSVEQGIQVLRRGGIILYPTDTIWGIGCDATNSQAVEKIYSLKQRSESKALLALVDSLAMLQRHVGPIPQLAYAFIEAHARPTTIVYPRASGLAPNLLAPDGSVGIRLVHHLLCQRIISALGKPLVSTSANPSGISFSGAFGDIHPSILQGVDFVYPESLATSTCSQSSRIIRMHDDGLSYTILRE